MTRDQVDAAPAVPYEGWQEVVKDQLKTLKVVSAGALAEPAVLWGVAFYIRGVAAETFEEFSLPFIPWIGVGVGVVGLIAAWGISHYLIRRNFQQLVSGTWGLSASLAGKLKSELGEVVEKLGDPGRLWAISVQAFLVRTWILQGAATVVAVTYLLQPSWMAIATGVVLFIALVRDYPTWMGTVQWISEGLRRLEYARTLHQLEAKGPKG